eukprot:608254-Rhodomonas_salina.2
MPCWLSESKEHRHVMTRLFKFQGPQAQAPNVDVNRIPASAAAGPGPGPWQQQQGWGVETY